MSSGLVRPYLLDESICHSLGVWCTFFVFIYLLTNILYANSADPDQTPRPHCLPRPHVLNVGHIWAASWQNQQNYCAPSEDSDQPGHSPSLIRVFTVRMSTPWVLSYPLSAQRRLWSDWADAQADLSLRWAQNQFVGFVMRLLIHVCVKHRKLSTETSCNNRKKNICSLTQYLRTETVISIWRKKEKKIAIQFFYNEWEHYQFSPLYNNISVLFKLNNTVVTISWVPNIKIHIYR